jgi:acetyl esterase/lipase
LRSLILVIYFAFAAANAMANPLSQPWNLAQMLNRPELTAPHADHTIAYGTAASQYGELWLPPASTKGALPVVVLIHGGCWRADLPGPELVGFLANDLRQHGVAVWSLTYRRLGEVGGGYPGTFQDIAEGVAQLNAMASQYQLDLARVVVSGHSAGGHLALWVAAQNQIPKNSVLKNAQPVHFKAVIGIAAIPDLAYYALAGAHACGVDTVDQLVDFATRKPTGDPFRDTSPSELLPLGVKQVLINGANDGIVPPFVSQRYQVQAQEVGEHVKLIKIDNAGHFELIAPWTEAGQVVVSEILDAVHAK